MDFDKILKLASRDKRFRSHLIEKLAASKLPKNIKEDMTDVVLSAQIEGRKKFLKKYLKENQLDKNVTIKYIGEEAWSAEIRFLYKDPKTGEYISDKRGLPIEFSLWVDMKKPQVSDR